jgi:hypothetical protein
MEIFMRIATCLSFGGIIIGVYIILRLLIELILDKFSFLESKWLLITLIVTFGLFMLALLTILCGVIIVCVFNVGG